MGAVNFLNVDILKNFELIHIKPKIIKCQLVFFEYEKITIFIGNVEFVSST